MAACVSLFIVEISFFRSALTSPILASLVAQMSFFCSVTSLHEMTQGRQVGYFVSWDTNDTPPPASSLSEHGASTGPPSVDMFFVVLGFTIIGSWFRLQVE